VEAVHGDTTILSANLGSALLRVKCELNDLLADDLGQQQNGGFAVFHQVLEDHVVDRIGYAHGFRLLFWIISLISFTL
ncbi:MAG: hypothetical protein D3908_13495, partial [Candidatus Electrothrix sp. AUS4]|nr:hypothetical protein [Candidatus Electrothrix sp. AUS4]